MSSTRIYSLCEGRRGELWIGTSGRKLYCFAEDRFIPVTLRDSGLASDVRALCEDREGNLWMGTGGAGLVMVRESNLTTLASPDKWQGRTRLGSGGARQRIRGGAGSHQLGWHHDQVFRRS